MRTATLLAVLASAPAAAQQAPCAFAEADLSGVWLSDTGAGVMENDLGLVMPIPPTAGTPFEIALDGDGTGRFTSLVGGRSVEATIKRTERDTLDFTGWRDAVPDVDGIDWLDREEAALAAGCDLQGMPTWTIEAQTLAEGGTTINVFLGLFQFSADGFYGYQQVDVLAEGFLTTLTTPVTLTRAAGGGGG